MTVVNAAVDAFVGVVHIGTNHQNKKSHYPDMLFIKIL